MSKLNLTYVAQLEFMFNLTKLTKLNVEYGQNRFHILYIAK